MTVAELTTAEVQQLGEHGFFIRERFLPEYLLKDAANTAAQLTAFKPAGVGQGAGYQLAPDVRSDEILWLDEHLPSPLKAVTEALDGLRQQLNTQAYLGLERSELQLARYLQPGAGYQRHRDAFERDTRRRVTAICYLNEDWLASHGGQLRLHLPEGALEIPPRLGTLVVFLSQKIEHEVLPSHAARYALTVWWGR